MKPAAFSYARPADWSEAIALIKAGATGQKVGAGFYKKVGRDVMRFDLASKDYVPAGQKADEVYGRMLKKPAGERLRLLRNAEGAEARFLWAILRDQFHYVADVNPGHPLPAGTQRAPGE